MKENLKLIGMSFLVVIVFYFLDSFFGYTGKFGYSYFKVTRVIDGDTLEISGGERVRLIGVNAPEKGSRFYYEAKKFLEEKVLNKVVRLEFEDRERDVYGRKLAYIFVQNKNVNVELVRRGLAYVFNLDKVLKYRKEFVEAEEYARNNELGIWSKSNFSKCLEFVNITYSEGKIVLKNVCNFTLNTSKWIIESEIYGRLLFPSSLIRANENIEITMKSSNITFKKGYKDNLFIRDSLGFLVLFYRR